MGLTLQLLCILMIINTFSLAKKSVKVSKSDQDSGAEIQKLVNMVFSEGNVPPLSEFSEDNNKKLDSLLRRIIIVGRKSSASTSAQAMVPPTTDKRGLMSAVNFAFNSITKRHLNPSLVKLALGIYLTHSDEAKHLGVVVPPLKDHSEFKMVQSDSTVDDAKMQPLINPVTADTMEGFGMLTYFREDYDLNTHHWNWHLIYPYAGIGYPNHRTIERQGELFLYIHAQLITRYNAELLSWGLNRVNPWSYDDIIPFGYTPVPGLRESYGARPPNQGWYDNEFSSISKKALNRWRNNVNTGINDGFFYTIKADGKDSKLMLTPENAMNWVGVVVEAENQGLQEVTPGEYTNRTMYGSVHNMGHEKFAEIGYHEYTSDRNALGIMVTNLGSLRDPCFWLWHTHIDEFRNAIVNKYNHSIDEFAPQVEITGLEIIPRGITSKAPTGGIATILGSPRLELNEVNAKIDHEPYKWRVTVQSIRKPPPSKTSPQTFTVRIFISPKVYIEDQRSWIEMDKFTHTLTDATDTLVRLDTESSVTRDTTTLCKESQAPSCLCGWPPSMMVPNGTPEGLEYVGFAMLTDDKLSYGETQSLSFCGGKDTKYPDPRGMGYPFDKIWLRRLNSTATVPEIIDDLPHTKLCEFKIYRYTKMYQGPESTPQILTNVTWEDTVKDFFTTKDVECMIAAADFNLGDKQDVIFHAPAIYYQVKTGKMPLDEERWSAEKVADFKTWIDAGTP